MNKLCPICKKLYRPGRFAEHMMKHVRRGEVTKREVVTTQKTQGRTYVYEVKARKA